MDTAIDKPVIFLDMDGVMNSGSYIRKRYEETEQPQNDPIDPDCIVRLNRLVEETGAVVVISSSWRYMYTAEEMSVLLAEHGFTGTVVGATPFEPHPRGNQIQAWLDLHPSVKRFVILDDDSDMVHLTRKLVKTHFLNGLLDVHVELAKKHLLGEQSAPTQ